MQKQREAQSKTFDLILSCIQARDVSVSRRRFVMTALNQCDLSQCLVLQHCMKWKRNKSLFWLCWVRNSCCVKQGLIVCPSCMTSSLIPLEQLRIMGSTLWVPWVSPLKWFMSPDDFWVILCVEQCSFHDIKTWTHSHWVWNSKCQWTFCASSRVVMCKVFDSIL